MAMSGMGDLRFPRLPAPRGSERIRCSENGDVAAAMLCGPVPNGAQVARRTALALAVLAALAACSDAAREPTSPAPLATQARRAVLTQGDGAVIMTKLANPRGLAWGPDGSLYVAEAGRGGTAPCMI